MKEVSKVLRCGKCGKEVVATNKFKDDRFYCVNCGMNLGIYAIKKNRRV